MHSGSPTIAIVGGGALGAALVGVLVERLGACRTKPRIVLFEKSSEVGRGLAYAKDDAPYVLNTSADTMSVAPGKGGDFLQWLRARGLVTGGGEQFSRRDLFGDYVEERFLATLEKARRRGIGVLVVRDEVDALTPRVSAGYRVVSRSHPPVDADLVVLAVGNLPSRAFPHLAGPRFFASPYPSGAFRGRIPREARVAILGTGLSAVDAALALVASGHEGPITMASRSGLLPSVRGPLREHVRRHATCANIARATGDGRHPLRWPTVLRWIEQELQAYGASVEWDRDFPAWVAPEEHLTREIAAAEHGGRPWQSIGEALNPVMDVLWHHLAEDDKRLFMARYKSRFMSYWVPIPLVTARRVLSALTSGKVHAKRGLREISKEGEGFRLLTVEGTTLADFVINATGAPRSLAESESPLLDALVQKGTVAPHEHGGVRVDFTSQRVVGADGVFDPSLLALGNLTCGTHLFTSTLDVNVDRADRIALYVEGELRRRMEKGRHVDAAPHSS